MIQKRINARSAITTFVFLLHILKVFAGITGPALSCVISGASVSCVNQLEFYYTAQTPGYTYIWAVPSGGTLSNTTGPSTMVNWTASGSRLVILTATDPGGGVSTCSLSVTVYPRPAPKIFTDFISDCQEPDKEPQGNLGEHESNTCWLVCENMTVNYWTTQEPGYSYQWTVVGGTPNTASGPSVSVVWGSPGPGSIILTATSPGGCSESITRCVTIIASPRAAFTFNNEFPDHPLEICRDETVYFNDLSVGAAQWLWNFGDGTTSNAQNPSHNYPGPGTYFGSLTVKNNCGCTDILLFQVNVSDRVSPDIGCISTLCLGECAFYTVTNINNCPDAYIEWSIHGGSIVNIPVNGSVNVVWDDADGFIDNNGYGLICARVKGCEGLCDEEVCVRVPIIHKARIFGPTEACVGEEVTYYVSNQPGINEPGGSPDGVNFDWSVAGNGFIISEFPYSNSITVQWYASGPASVSLAGYENYLGDPMCRFDPEPLSVNVKPTFTLSPEETTACVGQLVTITSSGTGVFNWTVSGPGGGTGPTPGGSSYSVSLTLPGTYIVTAASTSGVYCPNTPSAVIVANAPPPPPSGTLNGVTSVCANTPYTYTFSAPPPPGSIYAWTATGGTVYGGGGQTVSVQWSGTPPMSLSVRTRSNLEPYCESAPLNFPISLYTPPATFIAGPTASCINQTESYNALALSNFTNIQWSIVPATAASVVTGQGTQAITVLFNANAPASVQIVATATVCGATVTDIRTVAVGQIPAYSINAPATACENSSASLSVSPNTGIASYLWNFGDGTTSTSPTPVHSWAAAGTYPISVNMTLNICGNPTVTVGTTIQINPNPEAFVTGSNGFVVCQATGQTTDLTVTTQVFCNYAWSTGASGPVIHVTTAGLYSVTATEPGTGCSTVVVISVLECAPPPDPCIPVLPPWTFTASENCDTYTFTPIPSSANFIGWNFGDGSGSTSSGTVSHTYAHAGYYHVVLFSYDPIQRCTLIDVHTITVKFKGDFTATFDCHSGSMVTTLTDRSEYMPGFQVPPNWYDGSTLIGSGAVLNVTLTPGIHNMHLEANISGMVCSSPTQAINVPGMPQASFVHNAPQCEGNPVQFTNTSTGGGLTSFTWNFGDGASSGVMNPQRVYNAPPNSYTVTLTVSNDWGCSSSNSVAISITDKGADPTLSMAPNPPVCEGASILITATNSLPAVTNFTWFNAANPGAPLQGPSPLNTFTATSNGLYGVSVTDGNGCKYNVLAPQPVVITPPPYLNISGATDVCVGDEFNLSADIGPGFTYHWQITYPNGSSGTSSSPSIVINAFMAGPYTFAVTITNQAAGCTNAGSTTGTAHPGITDLSISSSNACVPAQLTANGTGIVTYNWSEGSTTQQILATQGGQYAVVVSDQWGCTAKAEYFLGSPPDLSNVMVGCYEFCSDVIWQAPNCAGCQYQWTLNGNPIPGETNPTIKIGNSGVYTVIVTNSYGCQSESDPIEISITGQCNVCDIKITNNLLVCRGKDPVSGKIIYEFWMDVINNGGALHGVTVVSDLGNVQVVFPPDGFIPGGGALTQVHGFMLWDNIQDFGCFSLLGYLTKDCSDVKECGAKWCGPVPPCCNGNCALKITKVQAVCITKGYYRVSATVTNYGCDLFDMYIETIFGNFPLTPSTILSGTSVTYSSVIAITPGTYGFRICGSDVAGVVCCSESQIEIPPCDNPSDCPLKVKVDKFKCTGRTPDGFWIYDFQLSVFGVPAGYFLEVVPQQIGYITNMNYNCLGTTCTITGTYYHITNSAGICLTVLALTPDEPPKVCIGQVCLDEPPCPGGKSDPRNSSEMLQGVQSQDFSLVPNPATQTVQVWRTEETDEPIELTLTDLYGRLVQVEQKVVEKGLQLDLSTLPAGVYIVTLTGTNGSRSSKKLLVGK